MTQTAVGAAATPPVPEPAVGPALRASDADRNHVAQVVQEALGAGMLTLAEAEDRLAAVYAARFRDALLPLTEDLSLGQPTLGSHSGAVPRHLVDAMHHLLAASALLRTAAFTVLARHRVMSAMLVLLGGVLIASVLMGTAAEMYLPEQSPGLTDR